ncbi:hypothetical protein FHX59_000423 [Paraburkholderia silvatlantica]|uniref:Demethylmenaquinone methyltransferase n=1 Tax=Paraburkholderia silvatlantica TaxID=321895 RepID=A0A2U1AD84_9BURK|nr:hypothetical protein [Paraburkholderia silvatlantica]PVY33550.1 demethylmenaquinone methyltransferase [Paraburkholderia silvatlantica]PXW38490.1 demethylmenaquinone methyltransferase [Paraburkholderia silvatlantica]PYE27702.1 demethylmenaquinone methyltransferase [Paraburkholderia silvatlantica]TDQ92942.1 demethylmenaquinone methyltransferase [Paraburkholderia silvatlantica]
MPARHDGPVRDSATIAAPGIPVFRAGASAPLNLCKHHTVDLNVPIGCGGVAVLPGDIIVGDAAGFGLRWLEPGESQQAERRIRVSAFAAGRPSKSASGP